MAPKHNGYLPSLPMFPPFAPTSSHATELCRIHSKIFLNEVKELKMWALKMYDASAKLPSGLLHGNVNQYGDFDECLSIDEVLDKSKYKLEDHKIMGKYCLSNIDIHTEDQNSNIIRHLQSHHMLKSNITDPGHRLPRFSSINWAFCIPSSCSATDLQKSVQDVLNNHSSSFEMSLSVTVNPQMCYTKHSWKSNIDIPTVICFTLLAALLLLTLYATAVDIRRYNQNMANENSWKLVNCPSDLLELKRNFKELFSLSSSSDDIQCIHGIRFLNALALLLSHKSIALFFNPFVNRTSMTVGLSYKWTVIARTAIIYTDSFVMISGLLTAYAFIKDLDKTKKLNVLQKYKTRLMRLTPNFIAVILLCTYILVPLGSGPQWNLVVKHHSDLCKSYMWRNFLYIHNYFGFKDMCLTHTHQLGMEMQLFLFSPLIVYLLWRWSDVGLSCIIINSDYSDSVSQLFATATNSYILPTHRVTSYLFGIGMGVFLRRMEKNITLSKFQVFLGWSLTLAMGLWAMMGPTQITSMDYVYKHHEAANYMAFSPVFWCIFVSWAIFATVTGYGGFFGDFLSWRGFVVSTRIAYSLYLIQFPIFFYNVGRKRTAEFYDLGVLFNIMELAFVVLASVVLTVLVDLPFQNLRKIRSSKAFGNL
ncbi:hypothetical protein J437_LFUL015954 [Ladona fulva]|uniref:Nose resistant-to-fluoxetine protein N-terminal domain-containing protein n=1 Tax=Ladona fulva TaxID=123851 RepID=A0A8K0JY27_LADFU|nr:hypothetical protein J437_LFUL015954 [Ladona fulva]